MARLAVTLTLLIALFAFTEASLIPLDLPIDDSSSIHDPSITLPEAESKRMILLPSEKPETEPATMVKLDHNEMETTVKFTDPEAEDITEEVEPEIFIHPRPVWTQDGDERKMFVFRRPRHRCNHPRGAPRPVHHHKFYHQFDGLRPMPELRQGEVSYGNDMLVAETETETETKTKTDTDTDTDTDTETETETETDPDPENGFGGEELEQDLVEIPMGHEGGGSRHAPLRWVGLHFGGRPRFPDEPDHENGRGPHHHHHHHHHDHHHPDEDEDHHPDRHHHDDREEEEHRRPGGGGLVKRMRKFLHQFDF